MLTDIVRAIAGNQHAQIAPEREYPALVLEQHQGFAHRLAGDLAVSRCGEIVRVAGACSPGRPRFGEQPHTRLDAEDPGNGVIDTPHAQIAILELRKQAPVDPAPVLGRHEHVDSGVDGLGAGLAEVLADLPKRVPVADDETREPHLLPEHMREQVPVTVQLGPVPVIEGSHHDLHAGRYRRHVALAVNVPQFRLGAAGTALIGAVIGAAFTDEMLCRRQDFSGTAQTQPCGVTLQAANEMRSIFADYLRAFRVAFVGPPPAVIPHYRKRGRKGPVDSGGGHLGRGRFADRLNQLRVPRGAQSDVVRIYGCAEDIRVSVHCIRAPDQGNAASGGRGFKKGIRERQPVIQRGALVVAGGAATPIEYRSDRAIGHIVGGEGRNLCLNHLCDFLLGSHPPKAIGDFRLDAGMSAAIPVERAPAIGPEQVVCARVHSLGALGAASDSRSTISQSNSRFLDPSSAPAMWSMRQNAAVEAISLIG